MMQRKAMRQFNPVGILMILVAAALAAVLLTGGFRIIGLNEELHKDCNLPEAVCPFKRELPTETWAGLGLSAALGVLGVVLIVRRVPVLAASATSATAPPSPAAPSPAHSEERQQVVEGLDADEKAIYDLIARAQGLLFQHELVDRSGMHKVKVTRVLDKLEGKGLVERRRRGMGNMVVLRQH
ncbi:MAG: MarR family transcriptional regulator [Candidatus Aenigmarchaeota archaeon]|nr:MarR family transcriptional regulator [Candidatus Aenigmarchaeota archaeon]